MQEKSKWLEAVATDWNEIYPNVSINYVKVDEYNQRPAKLVTADAKPDLVVYDLNSSYADNNIVQENLVNLNTIGLNTAVYAPGILDFSTAADERRVLISRNSKMACRWHAILLYSVFLSISTRLSAALESMAFRFQTR